uniref:rho guanine nucleotide exchange factor 5-like n=1 Tax=Myxine glutinosa TaxID=7769 RepID=UPI00358EA183
MGNRMCRLPWILCATLLTEILTKRKKSICSNIFTIDVLLEPGPEYLKCESQERAESIDKLTWNITSAATTGSCFTLHIALDAKHDSQTGHMERNSMGGVEKTFSIEVTEESGAVGTRRSHLVDDVDCPTTPGSCCIPTWQCKVQNGNPSRTKPNVDSDTKSTRPLDIQPNSGPIPKAVVHPLKLPLVPKPLDKRNTTDLSEKSPLQNMPDHGESKSETTTFAQSSNDSAPVAAKLNTSFGNSMESSTHQTFPLIYLDPPESMNKPVLVIQDENDSCTTSSCPDVLFGQELQKNHEVLADQKHENHGVEGEEIYEDFEENVYDDAQVTQRVPDEMKTEKLYKTGSKEKDNSKNVSDIQNKNIVSGGCKSGENEVFGLRKNMKTLLVSLFKNETGNCNVSCTPHALLQRNHSDCTQMSELVVEDGPDDRRSSCPVLKNCHEVQKEMDFQQVVVNETQRHCDDFGEEPFKNVEENLYDDVEVAVQTKWETTDHSQSPQCIKQKGSFGIYRKCEVKKKKPKKPDETHTSEKKQHMTLWYLFENELEPSGNGKGISSSEGEKNVPKRDFPTPARKKKSIPNAKDTWNRKAVIRRTHSDDIDEKAPGMPDHHHPRTSSNPLLNNFQELKKYLNLLEVPINLKQEQDGSDEDVHEKDEENVFIHVPVAVVEELCDCLWQNLPRVQNSGLLDTLSETELKRQEVMYEVYTTEKQFHSKLQFVIHHFVDSVELGNAITPHDKRFLFSNLGDIFDASTSFLEALEQRVKEVQISGVCDIVLKYTNGGFQKFVSYIRNQPYQNETFNKLCKLNTSFSEIMNKLSEHPKSGRLPLSAHLLLPMQRITRLQLLVERILKYTEEDSEERHFSQDALDALIKMIRQSNEDLKKMKQTEELVHIQNKIDFKDLKCLPVVSQSRYLIKEGELHVLKSTSKGNFKNAMKMGLQKGIYIFLFNDLILLTKKTGMKYEVFDSASRVMIEIQELPEGETTAENAFQLVLLENHKQKQTELALQASSLNDKERWISAISVPTVEDGHTIYEDWDCPKVCCIHNYSAEEADELEMTMGDIIKVTKKTSDGWFQGERIWDAAVGWFPCSYVNEINDEHVRARHLRQRYRLLCALTHVYEN